MTTIIVIIGMDCKNRLQNWEDFSRIIWVAPILLRKEGDIGLARDKKKTADSPISESQPCATTAAVGRTAGRDSDHLTFLMNVSAFTIAKLSQDGKTYFFFDDFRDLPALDRAIATACFCGLPAAISRLMLADTTFLDLPDWSGMIDFQ